jgi:hypothetical protein
LHPPIVTLLEPDRYRNGAKHWHGVFAVPEPKLKTILIAEDIVYTRGSEMFNISD